MLGSVRRYTTWRTCGALMRLKEHGRVLLRGLLQTHETRLLSVGTKMADWVVAGTEHYSKRIEREMNFSLIEIPLAKRIKNQSPAVGKARQLPFCLRLNRTTMSSRWTCRNNQHCATCRQAACIQDVRERSGASDWGLTAWMATVWGGQMSVGLYPR